MSTLRPVNAAVALLAAVGAAPVLAAVTAAADPGHATTPAAPVAWAPAPPPPPLTLAPAQARPPAPVQARLQGGLRIVVLERHQRSLVQLRLVLRRGALSDPLRQEGVTSLALHLATDYREVTEAGVTIAGEKSLRREVGDLGGALSVEVEADASVLALSGFARDVKRYLVLLAEAVTAPRHGERSFSSRRNALLDALDDLESSDPEALSRVIARAAFGEGHPYARAVDGTKRSLGPLGLEDVVAQQEAVLVPEGATLLVVGDVRADQVIAAARKAFAAWDREALPMPALPSAPVHRGPFDAGLLRRQPAATLLACATRPLGDLKATDGALEVLTALLGEGTRSRLAQSLREEGGYTYTAYAGVVRRRAARAFVACAPLAAARADEGLEAFRATLDGLRQRGPGDEELRRAKALRLARLDEAQEGVASETEAWTEALVLGQQEPRRAREEAEIAAVTAEELRRLAGIALRPEGLRWILSGDPAIAAKAVRANRLGRLLGLPLGR